MARKGWKMQAVVKVVDAPCQFSGRVYTYEKLACGHYHLKPEPRETAKIIREMFHVVSGEPIKRRCWECVTGRPSVPAISQDWLKNQTEE